MSLERHQLQLLVAIADHGQLGAAARSLHLSPSAASRRIREAERRLDVRLIEIDGRVARLTRAGRLLATTARSTEQQLIRAEQASRWLHHGRGVDRLRVGVGFFDRLAWHQELFDSAERLGVHSVDLVSVTGEREEQALRDGTIDLTIVASTDQPREAPGWTHLGDDRLVAVVPPGFVGRRPGVFDPTDVADHDYLAFSFEPLDGWELDRFLDPVESQPRSLRQVDRLTMVLALIGRGRGLSIQPELAVRDVVGGHEADVLELSIDLPVRWFVLTGPTPGEAVTQAVDLLLEARRSTSGRQAVSPPSTTNIE